MVNVQVAVSRQLSVAVHTTVLVPSGKELSDAGLQVITALEAHEPAAVGDGNVTRTGFVVHVHTVTLLGHVMVRGVCANVWAANVSTHPAIANPIKRRHTRVFMSAFLTVVIPYPFAANTTASRGYISIKNLPGKVTKNLPSLAGQIYPAEQCFRKAQSPSLRPRIGA